MKGKEIERYGEAEITCPYCGWENNDSWESGMEHDGDTTEEECPECNKKFHITLNVSATFTSTGLCEENNDKHDWKHFNHEKDDGGRCKGKKCLTCGEYVFDKDAKKGAKE